MPKPREVFDNPDNFWPFLKESSDDKFERQHFDRKEACQLDSNGSLSKSQISNLIDEIKATVSAFANRNVEGGLLVLGIASNVEHRPLQKNAHRLFMKAVFSDHLFWCHPLAIFDHIAQFPFTDPCILH